MNLNKISLLAAGSFALFVASCAQTPRQDSESLKRNPANWFGLSEGRLETEATVFLSQNWSQSDRETFYFTPQGSQIIPVRFAKALKAENNELFFSSDHLKSYGYIPQKPEPKLNPMGLPVGFTIDGFMGYGGLLNNPKPVGERWVGMNCAACHTGSMRYGDKQMRIDGGQSLSDFQQFVSAMDKAVFATEKNPNRLQEFVQAVSKSLDETVDSAQVEKDFKKFAAQRRTWQKMNASSHVFGAGRNDAFGVIFNQVLARDLGIPENAREPNAPVSYPVIWDAPHHDWVQWNGLASNDPNIGGPMARNLGQVLGVFGSVDFSRQTEKLGGYCSSARRLGLEQLEAEVRKLWSPQWPEKILGKLDSRKVALGANLYKQNCISCHALIQRDDSKRSVLAKMVKMSEVGTDQRMNLNAGTRTALTGSLIGRKTRLQGGRPLEREEAATFVLKHAVASALAGSISPNTCENSIETENLSLLGRWSNVVKKAVLDTPIHTGDEKQTRKEREAALQETLYKYKARPLNGIWASAPYLHNGSVRTLYQLLLPVREREREFVVGCTDFDPSEVGLKCDSSSGELKRRLDLTIDGNKNIGHEYATFELSHDERMSLIEYLKSL